MAKNILCQVIDKQTRDFASQLHLPLKYVSTLISAFISKNGGKSKVSLDNLRAMLKDRNDITYDYSDVVVDSKVEGLQVSTKGSTTIGFDSIEGFRSWVRSTDSPITDKVIELCDETNKWGLFCGYVGMDLIQAGAIKYTPEQLHAAMEEAYNKLFSYMAEIGQLNANNEYAGIKYGTRLGDLPIRFDGKEKAVEFKDGAYHINFSRMQEEFDTQAWKDDGLGFTFESFPDYYIYRVSKEYMLHNSPMQNIDMLTGLPTESTVNSVPETEESYKKRIADDAAEMYKSFKQFVHGVKIVDKNAKSKPSQKKIYRPKWSNIKLHTNGIQGADAEWTAAINKLFRKQPKVIKSYDSQEQKSSIPEKEKEAASLFLKDLFNSFLDHTFVKGITEEGALGAYQTAKEANAIYAVIDSFARPGDRWRGKDYGYRIKMPKGRAGITVMTAVKMQKPVHVYSEEDDSWFTYNGEDWIQEDTPVLTSNFAGIGSIFNNELQGKDAKRENHKKAINAIYSVIHKTQTEGWVAGKRTEASLSIPPKQRISQTLIDPETGQPMVVTGTGTALKTRKMRTEKQEPKKGTPVKENNSPVTRIISGGQTGADTIGLEVGRKLGIETGGTMTPGFVRERGIDSYTREQLEEFGLVEITKELQKGMSGKQFYLPRTEQNVINSDGTVYFASDVNSGGLRETKGFAEKHDKPFILNPTAEELREWIEENGIETLNVAGNRGSKLKNGDEVAQILEEALTMGTQEEESADFSDVIETHEGNWSRQEAMDNPNILYVFTDNTDRDSGSEAITDDSWYSEKYGKGHHFPKQTAAVVRGLDNARPISTQRWYHQGAKGPTGNWKDEDVNEFEAVIRDELEEIVEEFSTENYDTIMFPSGDGLFNTKISNITKERAPILYQKLAELLQEYGFDSLVPDDAETSEYDEVTQAAINAAHAADMARAKAQKDLATLDFHFSNKEDIEMPVKGVSAERYMKVVQNDALANLARAFNPIQRANAVEYLAHMFHDYISDKIYDTIDEMDEESQKDERAKHLHTEEGRREFIATVGVKGTIQDIQDEIDDYINHSDEDNIAYESDEEMSSFASRFKAMTQEEQLAFVKNKKESLQKIRDNWQLLWTEASGLIEKLEDVKIGWDSAIEDEDAEDDVDGTNAEEAREVSGNEGWAFKVNQDPKKTISSVTKRVLNDIEDVDQSGRVITNEYGKPKYVDSGYAHAVLLGEMSKILDPDEFCELEFSSRDENGVLTKAVLPALEEMSHKYHWVRNLIEKLTPQEWDSEEEAELKKDGHLISAFFTDLRRDYIPYSMVLKTEKEVPVYDKAGNEIKGRTQKKKIWVTKGINDAVAVDSIISQVVRNYNKHTLPAGSIFTVEGGVDTAARKAVAKLASSSDIKSNEVEKKAPVMAEILSKIGFNVTTETIRDLLNLHDGGERWKAIRESVDTILAGKGYTSGHYIDYFKRAYSKIAEALDLVSELDRVISFRQGDKTYQSYSVPNYMTTTIKSLKRNNNAKFLAQEYEPYEWFYDHDTDKYRSQWLQWLKDSADVRNHMSILDMNMMEDEAGEDVPYMNWTSEQIAFGFMMQYFSVPHNEQGTLQYARYNVPIYSDSPVVTFVTMPKFEDKLSEVTNEVVSFKTQLLEQMEKVVEQELLRIKEVLDRATNEGYEQIANYDIESPDDLGKNGAKFHFFPGLNGVVDSKTGKPDMAFYREVINLEGAERSQYIRKNLEQVMDIEFDIYFNEYGKTAAEKMAENGYFSKDEATVRNKAEEYFWNQAFATSQIIQITTTDLAYYKDNGGTDFQKRYKEVHAAGNKLNTNSKYGRKTEYSMIFYDIAEVSNSYESIESIVYQKLAEGKIPNKMAADFIISNFREVNSTNAQAFRSPRSYRAVMDMMGKWTPEMDTALQHFKSGQWDMNDFNVVWQTIKPYMFGHTRKGSVNGNIKVPQQHKNSEFLLIAIMGLIRDTPLAQNGVLQAMHDFMEENAIDVIQSEEAVKVGGQGKVNLLVDPEKFKAVTGKEATRENYVEYMDDKKNGINRLLARGEITIEEYRKRNLAIRPSYRPSDNSNLEQPEKNSIYRNVYDSLERRLYPDGRDGGEDDSVLHEFSYNDYCVQVPTPDHLLSKNKILAVFGSQFRNLIVSDISPDAKFTVDGQEYTKKELLDEYNALIVENLLDGWKNIQNKFATIESLQETLIHSIKSQGNYDQSLVDALQIVEVKGRKQFNIPLYNPSTTAKLQQIINSIFKNDITKQKIKGAACILVADVGKTEELQCVYENGKLKYVECYLPAYAKQFYEPFMNANGTLDYKNMPEELKKAIGYRIPTENKYSMAPLYIKGFLPQQNGSAIMLPADITVHAGSDFDVDKMFIMLPEFKAVTHNYDKLYDDYLEYRKSKQEVVDTKAASDTFYKENPQLFEDIEDSKEDFYMQEMIRMKHSVEEVQRNADAVQKYKNAVRDLRTLEEYLYADESEDVYIDLSRIPEANQLFKIIEDNKGIFREYQAIIKAQHKKGFDWSPKAKEEFTRWMSTIPEEKRQQFVTKPAEDAADFKQWLKMPSGTEGVTNKDARRLKHPRFEKIQYSGRGASSARNNTLEARNNRIIDIAYSILTNEDTVEKFLSPGNYNNLKGSSRLATITSNRNLIEAFCREYSTLDKVLKPEDIAPIILSKSTKELDDFLGKYSPAHNPLSPMTFIYYHKQNMTGGALIAMYANNATISAKFQEKGMEIVDEIKFNGHSYKKLSEMRDKEGILISQNCAEFLAAAVDNVKDPVLADVMQNTKTANIAALMLRLGMSIKEIGLLFTQPIVRACIFNTGGIYHATATHKGIETYIQMLQEAVHDQEFTKADGLNTDLNLIDLVQSNIDLSMDTMNKQWYINQIKVGWLFSNLIDYSRDLHSHTSVVRADSPNGAMSHTMAGNFIQRRNVRRLRYLEGQGRSTIRNVNPYDESLATDSAASMSIDDLRNAFLSSNMPILQTFYSLGIDFGHTLTQKYFYQQSDEVCQAIDRFLDNIKEGAENEDTLNDYLKYMTTYYLSKCPLFADEPGKTFFQKRDYYLKRFPDDLRKFLKKHKDIASMGVFKKMEINMNAQIVMQNSGRLDDMERQALMRDFDMLLYHEDPEVQQFATDLFCYSYYKDGFNFGPNSFGNFFSPTFIASFPSFIDTLRSLNDGVMNPDMYTAQYVLYHSQKDDGLIPCMPFTNSADLKKGKKNAQAEKKITSEGTVIVLDPEGEPTIGSFYNRYGGIQVYYYKNRSPAGEDGARIDDLYVLTNIREDGKREYTKFRKPRERRTGDCYNQGASLAALAEYVPEGKDSVRGVAAVTEEKPKKRKSNPQGVGRENTGEADEEVMTFTSSTGETYEVTDQNLCAQINGLFV